MAKRSNLEIGCGGLGEFFAKDESFIFHRFAIIAFLLACPLIMCGQTATVPAWGSPTFAPMVTTGAKTLAVNAANLNFSFHIPIVSKPGRGVPFTFGLNYNSDIYGIFNSQFLPLGNTDTMGPNPGQGAVSGPYWGWLSSGTASGGYLADDTKQGSCVYTYYYYGGSGQVTEYYSIYTDYRYYDENGTEHNFPGQTNSGNDCETAQNNLTVESAHGWQLKIASGAAEVIGPNGWQYLGANGPTEDTNGNYVTGTSDTTGTTMLSGSSSTNCYNPIDGNTYPNCTTFSIPSPGSGTVSWTEYYQNFSVASDSCSGENQYSGTASLLPVYIVLPEGSSWYYKFGYDSEGRVNSIRWPTGGATSITYGSLCSLLDGGPSSLAVWENDNNGNDAETVFDRSSGQTTVTYPDDNGTSQQVISWNGNDEPTDWRHYNTTGSGGSLLKDVQYTWGSPDTKTTYLYNGGTAVETNEIETTFDSYGMPSQITAIDYARDPSGNTKKITALAFSDSDSSSYTSLNILNVPTSITVTDGSGNLLSETVWGLDNYGLSSPATTPYQWDSSKGTYRGLANFETIYKTSSQTFSTKRVYDETGNLISTTAINGNQTGPGYSGISCYGAYPTSQGVPGGTESMSHDCATGLLLSKSGPNGNPYKYQYDAYGRLLSVLNPFGGTTSISYLSPNETEASINVDPSQADDRYTWTDGFGRSIFNQNNTNTEQTIYNAMGEAYQTSSPYSSSNGTPGQGTTFTTFQFDGLGRMVNTTLPNNDQYQIAYFANEAITTDPNSLEKALIYDGFGRLWKACDVTSQAGNASCGDYDGKSGYEAVYTYDMMGRLLNIVQANGDGTQTRSWTYDLMGRKLSSTQPEFNNGSQQTTTYTYDSVSNSQCSGGSSTSDGSLVLLTNGAGQVICYQYDQWGRLTNKNIQNGPDNSYTYDQTGSGFGSGLGRMTTASNASDTIEMGYNAMGETQQVNENIAGLGSRSTTYSYNEAGEMNGLTLPTGRSLAEAHDANGRLYKIADNNSGALYLDSRSFSPADQIASQNFGGSALQMSYIYNNVLEPTQMQYSPQGGGGYTLTYNWNGNGTLQSMDDSANSNYDMTYAYDDLGRLQQADESDNQIQTTFSIDAFGNRYNQQGTLNTTYTANPGTNQVSGFTYDGAGRVTAGNWNSNNYSLTWNAANELISYTMNSQSSINYIYDPFGRKIEIATAPSRYSYLLYGANTGNHPLAEYSSVTGEWQSNITAGTQLIATVTESSPINLSSPYAVQYVATDLLGTTRETVNSSGSSSGFATWYPYGEVGNNASPAEFMWTNMARDSNTGLDHFQFRDYDSALGRWLAPDPAGIAAANLTDPQSLDRYSYVDNDPSFALDNSGLLLTLSEAQGWCDVNATCNFTFGWANGASVNDMNPADPCAYVSSIGRGDCSLPPGLWDNGNPIMESGVSIDVYGNLYGNLPGTDIPLSRVPLPWQIQTSQPCGDFAPCNDLFPLWTLWPIKTILTDELKTFFCGNNPSDAVLKSMEIGATKGAVFGGYEGTVGFGIPTDGLGAYPGWLIGGVIGSVMGASSGVFTGVITAAVCKSFGAYQ